MTVLCFLFRQVWCVCNLTYNLILPPSSKTLTTPLSDHINHTQLNHIVSDDTCTLLLELHSNEENNQATGGALATQQRRLQLESKYARKAEQITNSSNCMKIVVTQVRGRLLFIYRRNFLFRFLCFFSLLLWFSFISRS